MSHNSPDQNRNLKPTLPPQNAYSASPSQLTLQSDMPPGGLPNPYHYGYVQHDPSGFAFPPQANYRPQPQQLQTRLPQVPPPPHLQQQPQQPSPTHPRKRRASEIGGDPSMPGPSGTNAAGFSAQPGMMGPPPDIDVNIPGNQPQQAPVASPVVKKGRTNTPWSPAEEHRLKMMRDQGSSWAEIAKQFPHRTEGSVKKHWYKDMHYADFGEDEVSSFVRLTAVPPRKNPQTDECKQSAALLQAIKEYDANKWKVIGQKVGKPAKACEQFAKEQGWKV